jgi:hypothetical protein
MVATLHRTQADLIADVGESAIVVLAACDQLDQAIADLRGWMNDDPCPDPGLTRCLGGLVSACSDLWTLMTTVAQMAPAGMDAGSTHLPASFGRYVEGRVDALANAWADIRRVGLI